MPFLAEGVKEQLVSADWRNYSNLSGNGVTVEE